MTTQTETADAVKAAALRKLRLDIGKLDSDTDADVISEIIGRIARGGLDGIIRERLLQTIKQPAGTSMGALRKQLADAIRAQRATGGNAGQIPGMILDVFNEP